MRVILVVMAVLLMAGLAFGEKCNLKGTAPVSGCTITQCQNADVYEYHSKSINQGNTDITCTYFSIGAYGEYIYEDRLQETGGPARCTFAEIDTFCMTGN